MRWGWRSDSAVEETGHDKSSQAVRRKRPLAGLFTAVLLPLPATMCWEPLGY